MSLRINHNLAAINAHRNLLNTTGELHSSMERLSSGFRINQGSDDPAGLVISEQFRAQIAGLDRAIENAEGSVSMIQTAEGALTEINALLVSMRELAIHAANEGFNDTDQLAADQAEIDNAIKTVDRIAANTQFGTKKLIDGTKANSATITTANSSKVTIKESYLSDGQHSITATKVKESTASLNTTSLGLSLAGTNGDPHNLSEKIHEVDVVQASDSAKKTSGKVDIKDAWGNGLQVAATAAVAAASIASNALAASTATASNAGTYTVVVNYQENGESPVGAQNLVINLEVGDKATQIAQKLQVAANSNEFLSGKVTFAGTDTSGTVGVLTSKTGAQYSLNIEGSNFEGSTGTPAALFDFGASSSRGISNRHMEVYARTASSSAGLTTTLSLAASTYNDLNTLVVTGGSSLQSQLDATFGTAKGSTDSDVNVEVVDGNKISFSTADEGSYYKIKVNDMTAGDESLIKALNISEDTLANTGTDALISFDGYSQAIDKVMYGTTHEVTLKNAEDGSSNQGTVAMKVAKGTNGIDVGNLLLDVQAARYDVRLDGGPSQTVVGGQESVVFNADRTESMKVVYGLTSEGGTEEINNVDRSLVFQIGANVGQTAKIGLRGMAAAMLGKGIEGNMYRSLSDIDVTTVQGAQDAQEIIDAAINEVSTTRGTLGSFQKNTLESTLRNLRVASQNLTASESMIRDTDMASEMSDFTKNQILVQAGTAMLAQANQTPQVVLQLFG
jgi:flagellin